MPKFKVWQSRCFEIEIEAESYDDALEQALSTPLRLWRDDHDVEYGIEAIEEEQTNA